MESEAGEARASERTTPELCLSSGMRNIKTPPPFFSRCLFFFFKASNGIFTL